MFCIPDDLHLTTSPAMPHFHYFVVTGGSGERLYGSCLRFYEEVEGEVVRRMEREDERVAEEVEAKEKEARERRKREISVSLSREEEREAELEEEMEREQAQRLISMHSRIQEEQARWRQQRTTANSPPPLHREEKEGKTPSAPHHHPLPPHPLAIQVQSSAPSLLTSGASPEPASPNLSPAPRVRSVSSTTPASSSSPTTASSPSPHLLCPPSISSSTPTSTSSSPPPTSPPPLRSRRVYSPKCIAVLSLYPFLSQSREFLSELYRTSLTPSHLPLEHLIANFVNEVPLPPLGELKVQYAISNKLIYFFRPPPNQPLLCTHYPLRLLFECLDCENALLVVEAVLMEQRLLLLSSKLSALTVVAETLLHLIFPLRWPHVYIPLLPRSLIDFLFAPMPFIIGMHHSYTRHQLTPDLLSDIIVVDLDHNRITVHGHDTSSDTKHPPRLRQLPPRERKKIKRGLSLLHLYKPKAQRSEYERRMLDSMDHAFSYAPSPDEIEQLMASQEKEAEELRRLLDAESPSGKQHASSPLHSPTSPAGLSTAPVNHELFISSVFFRAFTSLLKDYQAHLIYPTAADPHPDPCFNKRAFLKHHDAAAHPFLSDLLSTQAFTSFCEERIYHTAHTAAFEVRFFDESITGQFTTLHLLTSLPPDCDVLSPWSIRSPHELLTLPLHCPPHRSSFILCSRPPFP